MTQTQSDDLVTRLQYEARQIEWCEEEPANLLKEAAAEILRLQAQMAVAREALKDVCNPLGYLQRMAEAEGNRLGGMAYAIANDIGTVQKVARAALASIEGAAS